SQGFGGTAADVKWDRRGSHGRSAARELRPHVVPRGTERCARPAVPREAPRTPPNDRTPLTVEPPARDGPVPSERLRLRVERAGWTRERAEAVCAEPLTGKEFGCPTRAEGRRRPVMDSSRRAARRRSNARAPNRHLRRSAFWTLRGPRFHVERH